MAASAPSPATKPRRRFHRPAAALLLLMSTVIAEFAFSTPIHFAWLILVWIPIYGGGALLVRELVVRAGRGWPSVILLGIAYEIAEDGIGLQALTSPNLYHAADWGARVLGFNLPYWEVNAAYHVIFSMIIPLVIMDLLFPRFRGRPYVGRIGLTLTALLFVLGVAIIRVFVPMSQDPGYAATMGFVIGCLVVIVLLGVVALRVLPRWDRSERSLVAVPAPRWLAAIGFGFIVVTLGMLYPWKFLGARQPGFTYGWWVLVPMVIGAALLIIGARTALRWCRSEQWSEVHTVALTFGALVAHTVLGIGLAANPASTAGGTTVDRIALWIIAAATAAIGIIAARRLARRVVRRDSSDDQPDTCSANSSANRPGRASNAS